MSRTESGEDILDLRNIIERFEELESEREDFTLTIDDEDEDQADRDTARTELAEWDDENGEELRTITTLLAELKGSGGDEQWRGDWYPVTLIADDYFEDYARELADDIGAIDRNAKWPTNHIDWKAAASELQQDYSSVEYDGVTYWYR